MSALLELIFPFSDMSKISSPFLHDHFISSVILSPRPRPVVVVESNKALIFRENSVKIERMGNARYEETIV